MKKQAFSMNYYKGFVIALLLLFAGVSCLPFAARPSTTPVVTVVQVNREVTRVVVREVTREVIQTVEVPVTVTPTPIPIDTDTPVATQAPVSAASPTSLLTAVPPVVTMLVHAQCLYGPDPAYLSRYDLLAASQQVVIGRNPDGSWLFVQGSDHKNPCWVKAELVKVNSGSLDATLVSEPVLSPYSNLYPPPPAVSTNRVGNAVTIFWLPVPMTEADYHGYLIEAWVCQGGKQVFAPVSYITSYDKNDSMLAVKVTDEPGCSEPSSARIYTVNNLGYSPWKKVPWPVWPTLSPTLTPTP
jgi:hypothetical protein